MYKTYIFLLNSGIGPFIGILKKNTHMYKNFLDIMKIVNNIVNHIDLYKDWLLKYLCCNVQYQ